MQNVAPLFIKPTGKPEEIKNTDKSEQALASALNAFEAWRILNKQNKVSSPIPEELWSQIFSLEAYFSGVQLRRFFNLSTRQYSAKRDKLFPNAPIKTAGPATVQREAPIKAPVAVPELCEIKLKKESPYALEPLPSVKTVVVEFCRHDGQCMKIHTTQDSIPTLMRQFLGE